MYFLKSLFLCACLFFAQFSVVTSVNAYELKYELMSEDEIDARISFLDKQMSDIRRNYAYWHYGWSSVYAVSGALGIAKALDADNSADETLQWVSATKSLGGLISVQLLNPIPIVIDDDQFQEAPEFSLDDKIKKLKAGEKLLSKTARMADNRFKIKPHALTIGVNLLGGAIIAAYGDEKDALASTVLGIISGEAAIWTQPTAAENSWNNYINHFNGRKGDDQSWYLVPQLNGLEVVVNF